MSYSKIIACIPFFIFALCNASAPNPDPTSNNPGHPIQQKKRALRIELPVHRCPDCPECGLQQQPHHARQRSKVQSPLSAVEAATAELILQLPHHFRQRSQVQSPLAVVEAAAAELFMKQYAEPRQPSGKSDPQ